MKKNYTIHFLSPGQRRLKIRALRPFATALLMLAFMLSSSIGWGQTTIVNYDFNSGTSDETLTPILAANISSVFSCTEPWVTYSGTSTGALAFTVNSTAGSARGMANSSGSNTKYYQVQLGGTALNTYTTFKVYLQARRSSTGAQTVTLAYSTDGINYTDFGTTMSPGNGSFSEGLFDLSAITSINNPTDLYIRLLAGGASGTGTLRIDNLQIQGVQEGVPVLIASPATLSNFSYIFGAGPSFSQSYSLSGTDLTGAPDDILITGSANYEVSSDNLNFGSTTTITYTSSTLPATPVYVRLKAGLALGTYDGELIANAGGGASTVNVTCNGAVLLPEPTNHATAFLAGTPTTLSIPLTWTDATGGTVPTGYLIKASATGYGDIVAPVDNTPESDGLFVKNIAAGVEAVTFDNLQPNTTHYFKIWPYTNSGSFIDYKTDGTIPEQSASTVPLYFRSAASGIWNVAATWEISNDNTTWAPATTEIPVYRTSDVTVRTGHMVTYPTSYTQGTTHDLTVESGAVLYANATSGFCFIYVFGDILNDGVIGGVDDVIGFDIEGPTCTLSGSGTFDISRMAKFTTVNAVTDFTIDQDVTLYYNGTSPALSNNNPGTTTFNITLTPGTRLSVLNANINLNGCTLTLSSDASGTASLIDNGITGTGTVTVERYIAGWTNDMTGWHLLSSPVAAQTVAPAFTDPTPGNYDFYAWDEVSDLWLNQKEPGNGITTFTPGTGYLVAYQSTGTREFVGDLNNADVVAGNLTLTPANVYSGWNLAGNPFPSALKWNDGVNWTVPTEIAGTAKIWDESTASYVDIASNGIIPSMNGFMVQVLSGSPASLIIPIAARVHDATPWYKSGAEKIRLIASESTYGTAQESIIAMNELATEGYDGAFDSRFLPGYAPQLYSKAGDEMLSTNTLPDLNTSRVIEMGFVKNAAGEFSIGLDPDIALPVQAVYLTDKKTNVMTELSQGAAYTFTASEGDDTDRFLLHFGPLGIDDPALASPFTVYASAGVIYIHSSQAEAATVTVTNLLGQVVMRHQAEGNSLTTLSAGQLTDGIYIVSVQSGSRMVNGKVLIR